MEFSDLFGKMLKTTEKLVIEGLCFEPLFSPPPKNVSLRKGAGGADKNERRGEEGVWYFGQLLLGPMSLRPGPSRPATLSQKKKRTMFCLPKRRC